MSFYVTSKDYKDVVLPDEPFLIVHTDKSKLYCFCAKCRTFTIADKQSKNGALIKQNTCPHCGKIDLNIGRLPAFGSSYIHVNRYGKCEVCAVDAITLNHTVNDDGSWKDVNATIFYRTYWFSKDGTTQQSYSYYRRITCNFMMNQIYLIEHKPRRKGYPVFKHYLPIHAYNQENALLGSYLCPIIFDYYNSNLAAGDTLFSKSFMYSTLPYLFAALKFPVVAASPYYDTNILGILHFACDHDKVFRDAVTVRSISAYRQNVFEICSVFSNFDVDYEFLYHPFTMLYARYMYQLGFRDFMSVELVVSKWMSILHADESHRFISGWLYDFVLKRDHVRKKFYRRFLKAHGEADAIEQFLTSTFGIYVAPSVPTIELFTTFWATLHAEPSFVEDLDYGMTCDQLLHSVPSLIYS